MLHLLKKFKKPLFKFKIIIIFSLILFGVLVFINQSVQAAIIFQENWDSGTPPANFPNVAEVTWNGWQTCDYDCTGYSEVTTSRYHSAPKSLYVRKNANEYSVRDILRDFSPVTEIRLRFYVYFAPNYNYSEEKYIHFLFLQTARSGTGVRFDIWPGPERTVGSGSTANPPLSYPWPPTCVNQPGTGYMVINSPNGGTYKGITHGVENLCFPVTQNTGRWIPVEWAYKIISSSEGRASLWIDDVQRMKDELIPPDPSYLDIGRLILSGYASLGGGQLDYYIDDIVVTDDYNIPIGTGAGDTTPPAAPTGVTIS